MMKFRFTVLLVLSFIILAFGANVSPAFAQSTTQPTGFKNVTLWLYPEYDNPRLLMMLEGQITGAEPPALVRFLVPQTAEMYSAGSKDSQGKYTGGPPARKASPIPGWDEISYTVTSNTFRVEYYDDIIKGSPDKKIAYDFRWTYAISDLRIIIQQPKAASDFVTVPAGTQTFEDAFTVYTLNKSNLNLEPNNQPLHFDISYTKTDPNPSINETISAIDPGSSTGGSANSNSNIVPLIFIVITLVVIVVFVMLMLMKKRSRRHVRNSAVRAGFAGNLKPGRQFNKEKRLNRMNMNQSDARGSHSRMAEPGSEEHNNYCDQCGRPIYRSNKFCPNCGNKLVLQP